MASTLLGTDKDEEQEGRQLGGQMSFLEHLDELRRRIIRSVIFIFVALIFCWFVSGPICPSAPRATRTATDAPGGTTLVPSLVVSSKT